MTECEGCSVGVCGVCMIPCSNDCAHGRQDILDTMDYRSLEPLSETTEALAEIATLYKDPDCYREGRVLDRLYVLDLLLSEFQTR